MICYLCFFGMGALREEEGAEGVVRPLEGAARSPDNSYDPCCQDRRISVVVMVKISRR
jgi:hypothetical protein